MIYPGIDLGTTYSMIAHVNAHGQPSLFPDLADANNFRTPSVIHLGPQGSFIGGAAEDLLDEGVEVDVIRFIKTRLSEQDFAYVDYLGRTWNAVGLSALILKKLLRDATAFAGEDFGAAVVTAPAQFTVEQRRATLDAADLAGLRNVRLIEEPVAAAAYYGQFEGAADRTLMVYDFGGGTFDVTLLQTSPDGLFVLATDGDSRLGGRDIDEAIMQVVDHDFRARFGAAPLADFTARQRLRRICEDTKIKLARPGAGQVRQPILLLGKPYEIAFTRSQLDEIVGPAVERTFAACERCLQSVGLRWGDLDKIMLTGGSSLLTHVPQGLARRWGRTPAELVIKQPHQAVAYGAAILAQMFAGDPAARTTLHQVANADLALRIWDSERAAPGLELLIARNTPLPARHTRTVYTSRPDQSDIILEFVQRRQEQETTETSLGRFVFGPIDAPRRHYPIELTLEMTPDGLVNIGARDALTGRSVNHTLAEDGARGADLQSQRRLVGSIDFGPY